MGSTLDRGRTVRKYLAQHAEPEARMSLPCAGRFGHVVVIPAAGEGERLLETLRSIPPSVAGRLVTLVVNARESSPAVHHEANAVTLERLGVRGTDVLTSLAPDSWLERGTAADCLLVVNRAIPGQFLPEKQGVGLARKIGADLALALWEAGSIESSWICCTDADALLPADYFSRLPCETGSTDCLAKLPTATRSTDRLTGLPTATRSTVYFTGVSSHLGSTEASSMSATARSRVVRGDHGAASQTRNNSPQPVPLAAVIFPFSHRAVDSAPASQVSPVDSASAQRARAAIELYESFLRYQRLGLMWAGSPYAFHSIGSTIAIDAESYAAVRGFPKKMAGEDFYLLNKLAKVGAIHCLEGDPILLSGRVSDRVPFGTGRAMGQLVPVEFDHGSYLFPDPRAFAVLGRWLDLLEEWIQTACAGSFVPDTIAMASERDHSETERALAMKVRNIFPSSFASWIESEGLLRAIAELLADASTEARTARAVHGWFDAFRTMMFLHGLRDLGYPDLPYRAALQRAEFLERLIGSREVSDPDRAYRAAAEMPTESEAPVTDILDALMKLDREMGVRTFARAIGVPMSRNSERDREPPPIGQDASLHEEGSVQHAPPEAASVPEVSLGPHPEHLGPRGL